MLKIMFQNKQNNDNKKHTLNIGLFPVCINL